MNESLFDEMHEQLQRLKDGFTAFNQAIQELEAAWNTFNTKLGEDQ